VNDSIAREKEVKKWRREKKEALIMSFNPEKKFLNFELFDGWLPNKCFIGKSCGCVADSSLGKFHFS